ncbi:MAG: hypothetical protein K9I68_05255 [Bacteroidales bacterium]|nr:hypothetical protein [Bacteroidales bacterium]MCF8337684.1 hypothetical protein [Bacteroidales bacterium]
MRPLALTLIIILAGLSLKAQTLDTIRGEVSYLSSKNVYVKFENTDNISEGDTLYFLQKNRLVPALEVNNLSSISCVGTPLQDRQIKEDDVLLATFRTKEKALQKPKEEVADKKSDTVKPEEKPQEEKATTTTGEEDAGEREQSLDGRISVASYSNFSNTPGGNSQRMRYTFSFDAENLGGSKFSAESYVSFRHQGNQWNEVQNNLFNALKIYDLSLKYDKSKSMKVWLGRKINPKISSLGAIDGLQAEKGFNDFTVGAIAGTRPDYTDYSFNLDLFQYGAYFAHDHDVGDGSVRSTLGIIEQKNSSKTDRRFAYFQHTNTILEDVYFYGTMEMDLYENLNDNPQNTFDLTNLYLSLRYRPVRKLSLTASYSARENVIYYETYKNLLDSIINSETRLGYRFRVRYNPANNLTIGARAGYRYQKDDPSRSKNLRGYVSYRHIPYLKASATMSAMIMESAYLNGNIYSLRLYRDIIANELYGGIMYRYVDYDYSENPLSQIQNIGEINLRWQVWDELSLSVHYEGTFQENDQFNRVYLNLRKGF